MDILTFAFFIIVLGSLIKEYLTSSSIGGLMEWFINIFKIVIALGILNAWIVRFKKETPWRGGNAKNMKEEFEVYGLPAWFMIVIGFFKVTLAVALVAGIWYPGLTNFAAGGIAAFMLAAVVMHIKVKDPLKKSLPALIFLILSLLIIFY